MARGRKWSEAKLHELQNMCVGPAVICRDGKGPLVIRWDGRLSNDWPSKRTNAFRIQHKLPGCKLPEIDQLSSAAPMPETMCLSMSSDFAWKPETVPKLQQR